MLLKILSMNISVYFANNYCLGGIMDIKCRKTGCRFNKGQTCIAKFVDINNNTECKSFVRGGEDKDYSSLMFETAPEYANFRHIKDVNLKCNKQSCLFNNNQKCNANGITVLDNNGCPNCGTFIKD